VPAVAGLATEPAHVFEDRMYPGQWRVEWFDGDRGSELAIFSGLNARERAIIFADRCYGDYEEA
jgi:hypothetical protein